MVACIGADESVEDQLFWGYQAELTKAGSLDMRADVSEWLFFRRTQYLWWSSASTLCHDDGDSGGSLG